MHYVFLLLLFLYTVYTVYILKSLELVKNNVLLNQKEKARDG